MQKKLLGVAVAAALAAPTLALAQSSVQVYGTVHMSANQVRFSGDNLGNPGQTKYGVTQHASNWGLRSTESLGGGLTAWFQAEFNMVMERAVMAPNGPMSARNSGIGLRGAWGNIYFGNWETPWAQTFRLWDVGTIGGWGPTTSIIGRRETTNSGRMWNCQNVPGSTGGGNAPAAVGTAGSPVCGNAADGATSFSTTGSNLGYALWRRAGQSIFYESPVWSGVQLKLMVQPNQTKSDYATSATTAATSVTATSGIVANTSMWSGTLAWTGLGGRARAFIGTMRAKDWTTVGSTDQGWNIGGGYDFGVANVGATYERYTYKGSTSAGVVTSLPLGDVNAREWAIGVAIPAGPGHVGISYANAKQLDGSGIPPSAGTFSNDTSAKMWNIGYQWDLSKRTALGFGVAKIDNGANVGFTWTGQLDSPNGIASGAVNPGTDQTNIFVSIRHSF